MTSETLKVKIGDIKVGKIGQSIPYYVPIRCDRKTVLGNPFYMSHESQRIEVCNKFEDYLPTAYQTNPKVRSEITNIVLHVGAGLDVLLQCWCAPKRCHCDSIKSFVLNLINSPDTV